EPGEFGLSLPSETSRGSLVLCELDTPLMVLPCERAAATGEAHRDASRHLGPPLLDPATTIDGEGAKVGRAEADPLSIGHSTCQPSVPQAPPSRAHHRSRLLCVAVGVAAARTPRMQSPGGSGNKIHSAAPERSRRA